MCKGVSEKKKPPEEEEVPIQFQCLCHKMTDTRTVLCASVLISLVYLLCVQQGAICSRTFTHRVSFMGNSDFFPDIVLASGLWPHTKVVMQLPW